jgi:hypothetical protein
MKKTTKEGLNLIKKNLYKIIKKPEKTEIRTIATRKREVFFFLNKNRRKTLKTKYTKHLFNYLTNLHYLQ